MDAGIDELKSVFDLVLRPLLVALEEMVYKEEHILLPMCLDRLTEAEWYEIYRQTAEELVAILNALPVDITFVDREDKFKYYSENRERIFHRTLAVLNRDVRMCRPPKSIGMVEKILDDFKSGRESRAPFWIDMNGRFIHIEYHALRDEDGHYLGTLEVTQDLTGLRALEGEQRLLSYAKGRDES